MQNSSQDFAISNPLTNRLTVHEIPSMMSPSSHCNQHLGLSTPEKKDFGNSKSPLANLRLKKSKRRECTPAYSPKNKEEKSFGFWTEKVDKQRLNFENLEKVELSGNNKASESNKNFLNLIEESLNDVSDSYFGHLGSQTTPDTIFKNIFSEDKETLSTNKYASFEAVANEFKLKNVNLLLYMNTRVVYFDVHLSCFEMALVDIVSNLVDFNWDPSRITVTDDVLFLPGTITLKEGNLYSRLVFELKEGVRLAVVEIYLVNN